MSDGTTTTTTSGSNGQGGTTVTPPPPASTTTPPPAPADWTTGLNDDLKGFVQTKGFKDPAGVLDSYRNLEKLIGQKERLVTLPVRDDDAEGWKQVFTRLGMPEKPEGYQIEVPKEGGDPKFAEFARGMFHEAGLTAKQGQKLVAKWNEYIGGATKTQQETQAAQVEQERVALKTEWGAAFEQNLQLGDAAAEKFGIDEATMKKLESAMGFKQLATFMHKIGSQIGEHDFVSGGANKGFGGAMTPEQARHRISSLKGDSDFVRRYTAGELSAKEEMERLHKFAYPEN